MFKNIIILFLFLELNLYSQVITWTPSFATENDSLTVIFDATKGNKGLQGFTGDVYAHTGLITNLSISPTDWKYVKTQWGQNTPETKLTRIGTDLYQYKISPTVRQFYNVTNTSEKVLKVAFVFRSADNSRTGREADGGDIFLPLSTAGLNVRFTAPTTFPIIKTLNETLTITAESNNATNLAIYENNVLIQQTSNSTLTINYTCNSYGKKWIKAIATGASGDTKADSFYIVVRTNLTMQELPTGLKDGINYFSDNPNKVTLVLYAPMKDYVYVIGDFNNWEVDPNYYMKITPDGKRYWIEINNLTPGEEYGFQYLVNGSLRIADPYCEKVLDPWNDKYISPTTYPNLKPYPEGKTSHLVSVLQTNQQPYNWEVPNFQRPKPENLVIYELLMRDFISAHDYKTLIDTLSYLKTLGVNAIELLPVMEFEGNISWGYNPALMFAPDKYYGTKNMLKKFIDEAHKAGIAVILDIVLNHQFGNSPLVRLYWDAANNRPAENSPWFNPIAKHPYNVGYDMNHESQATKDYVDRVNKFWLTEYKIDGFRYDLSKGFTQFNSGNDVGLWGQYDQSRINILKRMMDKIREYDSTAYLILEHFADNSEETVLSNFGFLIWGKMNYNYNEATMGWHDGGKSNLSNGIYKTRGWSKPNLVTYMESHDEERLMYKNILYGNSSGSYNIKTLNTALDRMKLAGAFFFTIPGPKMIWQFGELGYDFSIFYPCGNDGCKTDPKPIRWDYKNNSNRMSLYKTYSALINLKKNYEVFNTTDFIYDDQGSLKRLLLRHSSMDVLVLGNFDVVTKTINPNFSKQGYWYNYFVGDSVNIINPNESVTLQPGEFRLYTTKKLPKPDTTGVISSISEETGNPLNYNLSQNYPNPFNPSTKIEYSILNKEKVTLKIYDILGNLVQTLIDDEHLPGKYSIVWNASNYPSGIYFYELKTENFRNTKKMILIK